MTFRVESISKRAPLFAWPAWFSLLMGMPYIVHAGRYGAVFSSTYGFAALGVLAGLFAVLGFARFWRAHGADGSLNSETGLRATDVPKVGVWRRLIVVGGVVSTACLCIFQVASFADFDAAVFGVASEMPAPLCAFIHAVARLDSLEPLLSFAAAASCSAAFSLVFLEKERGDSLSAPLSTFVLALVFGFCSRFLWVGIAPVVYGSTGFEVGSDCIFAACVPLAFVFSFLLCACLYEPRKRLSGHSFASRLIVSAIGCALGILAWTCLGRVVKTNDFVSPQVAFGVVAIVVAAAFAYRVFAGRSSSSDSCDDSRASAIDADARESRLRSFGLSPRELEASLLLLEGKNSEEAATCMGVKAATVRSLLQRAYKKAGVSNAADFLSVCGEGEAQARSDSCQESELRAGMGKGAVVARFLIAPTILCFMAICFLPFTLPYGGWGIGREFVYGLGFGFLVAGIVAAAVASGFILVKNEFHSKCSWAIGLLLCASAAASFYCASILRFRLLSTEWEKAVAFGASALFAAVCAWVIFVAGRNKGERTAGMKRMEACAWIAAVCVFAATRIIPDSFAFVCFVLAGGLGFLAAWALREARFESEESSGTFGMGSPFATAALLFVVMACGFLWEEAWRDEGYFSLMDFGVVFCSAAFVAVVMLLGRKYAVVSTLAASLLSVVLLIVGSTSALVVLFTLSAACMVRRSVRERLLDWRGIGGAFFAFGMGLIAGDILINHIGDRLGFGYRARLFDFLPEGDGAKIVALCISSMLFSAAFLSVVAHCVYMHRFAARSHVLESLSRSADERMVGYLVGRGLSDPYARIVADIAQGKTSGEIVRTRFYSRGSINDARRKGYALLGVHSQEELAALIQREMGL